MIAALTGAAMFLAVALLTGLASPALAEGDVAKGAALAAEHCTRCHDISVGGAFKLFPPSFASIAVFRSPEQIRGKILFAGLHSAMPDVSYIVTPDNVDDLVAYIVSLENK